MQRCAAANARQLSAVELEALQSKWEDTPRHHTLLQLTVLRHLPFLAIFRSTPTAFYLVAGVTSNVAVYLLPTILLRCNGCYDVQHPLDPSAEDVVADANGADKPKPAAANQSVAAAAADPRCSDAEAEVGKGEAKAMASKWEGRSKASKWEVSRQSDDESDDDDDDDLRRKKKPTETTAAVKLKGSVLGAGAGLDGLMKAYKRKKVRWECCSQRAVLL